MTNPETNKRTGNATGTGSLPFGALGLSILVHLAVLLSVGGVVLVKGIIPKQSFEDLGSGVAVGEEMVEFPDEFQDAPNDLPELPTVSEFNPTPAPATEAGGMDVIVSSAPSPSFSVLGASAVSVPVVGATQLGGGVGAKKEGEADAAPRAPGSMKSFRIFNQEVQGNSIGVVLDISRTTHEFFPLAVAEVAKNFTNAPTVLVMGCGMMPNPRAPSVPVVPFSTLQIKPETKLASPPTIENQIGFAMALGKDTEKLLRKMQASEHVFALQSAPGQINSTHFAFEKLYGLGVDSIYWFSDFTDKLDPALLEALQKSLKAKKIKLIAHNFTGKPVPPSLDKVVQETGGKSITVIPK